MGPIKDKIRKYFNIKVGKWNQLLGPTVPLKTGQPPTAGTIIVRKERIDQFREASGLSWEAWRGSGRASDCCPMVQGSNPAIR
jgi:hypothetical protein